MSDYLTEAKNKVETYFATHEISPYFYQCLFGEFIKIFGVRFIIPDINYDAEYDEDGELIPCDESDYSYKDQVDYYLNHLGGTGGWNLAFKEACKQCDLEDLLEYYAQLDWVHSDIFDGFIADNTVKVLFDDNDVISYYRYKIQKENT